jgi:hypothetical protein
MSWGNGFRQVMHNRWQAMNASKEDSSQMNHTRMASWLVASACAVAASGAALAADPHRDQTRTQAREQIQGSHATTLRYRSTYQAQARHAPSDPGQGFGPRDGSPRGGGAGPGPATARSGSGR